MPPPKYNNCKTCGKDCYGKQCRICFEKKRGTRVSQMWATTRKDKKENVINK